MHYPDAFARPFQNLKKLTLGAILNGLPLLNLITGLIVTGYTVKCAQLTLAHKNTLPDWKEWWTHLKHGFFATLIWAIYSIPLFLLLFILIFKSIKLFLDQANLQITLLHAFQQNWIFFTLLILLFLLTWYIALLSVIYYAAHYRFREAFRFYEIFTQAFTLSYFKAWIVALAYTALISLILQGILLMIKSESLFLGVVYHLFSGYLTFIAALTTMTLCAQSLVKKTTPYR